MTPAYTMSSTIFKALPWGTEHPHYKSKDRRIPWTPKEVCFIGTWITTAIENGIARHGLVGKCRIAIANDYPEMIKYFHQGHVVNVEKFLHGYRRYQELEKRKS